MKTLVRLSLISGLACILCSAASPQNAQALKTSKKPLKVAAVNFKTCVENSKVGEQEQRNFESLKTQMEKILQEKEKALNEIAAKFNDPDYLDSLSQDAENELKHKFRALSQEMNQHQQQYMQALNQANFKIVQRIGESIARASTQVAEKNEIDIVLNEETSFYHSPSIDISHEVVEVMNQHFDQEN